MNRFILRFTAGSARMRATPGVTVEDSVPHRMFLIEALPQAVRPRPKPCLIGPI
jgi:hypothetical protein